MTYTGREATPGTILTIITFGLLLIVNLITPIIVSLNFVKILRKSTAEELTIGLWGYCAQNNGEPKKCTSPRIGFAFDASKSLNPNLVPDLPGAINTTLSYLVVVHIIALITLSIVTCVGAFAHTRKNRDRAGSFYLAEFDIAYYLMIACLVSSGLATISFFVGKIMNKRRRSSEEELEEEIDDIHSEQRMNEGFREQNQHIPKYAEFEEDVVIDEAIKPSATQFPPGSQPGPDYFNSMRVAGPPNPQQSYPMRPYQGHSSRPTSPSGRLLPSSPTGIPQQFSYPPLSTSPTYPNAYNSYSTTSPPYPSDNYHFPSNQPPIQSYDTYPNSNNSNIYRPPQSSHHWQPPDNYY
ncbi:SUR7/PalI family-domain-containing protein [Glomus cerebriforme]|uniref:SUR7/PalI family-domain-containing protein n=1 Tax=Glomus cerebriforme TaxID=658196 RepID=A0A397SZW5_9GLOM|nr:SUR7/PalI family-domain-containing protein [Glomus cerebriforme]